MTEIHNETATASSISRRSLVKAAAWSAPAVAVAVSVPLAAATTSPPVTPTASVTGSIGATGTNATVRTATYSGGALSYDSAGQPGVDSGNITITIYNTKSTQGWAIADLAAFVAAYQAAGWTLVGSATQAATSFTHAPVSNGSTITMPAVTWTAPVGSGKPVLGISVTSDSDDVSGAGVSLA